MAYIEGAYEQATHRLASFDLRFDAIDRKLESLRANVTASIDALRFEHEASRQELIAKIDRSFMWTIALVFGTWATATVAIVAAIVHH